ncbi:uncharacterized protein LOC101744055 isoform X1 [Bombyx mori]|uniref:Uncharacterized protein n=1 Tax=Bombyx mori TaxID=7091 RepID=A0A8R2CA35_BOMMO|nr:uncharacterized protein LOC101744055 isoform X1 [Bombyx mori]
MENISFEEKYDSENSSNSNILSQNSTQKPTESIISREYPFKNLFEFNDKSWTPFVNQENIKIPKNEQSNMQQMRQYAECKESLQSFYHLKQDPVNELKQSTKRLLLLVEEIQLRIHRNTSYVEDRNNERPIPLLDDTNEDEDCSAYKRLIRKCHCLNREEFNDFIIHFNEDTKHFTNTLGEIIKNVRIVKKFLYMGGPYTKNALVFLNEALSESSFAEKAEIMEGVSHADLCNIFENHSLVFTFINWPSRYEDLKDVVVQNSTAYLLFKLSQLTEGRRYLNFNSKITSEIKKVLRKKSSQLESNTIELLTSTINLLHPPLNESSNFAYNCQAIREGYGRKILNILLNYKDYMTLDVLLTHLDLLQNLSKQEDGQIELIKLLPEMLNLIKSLLTQHDNSLMNVVITNILSNLSPKVNDDDRYLTTTVSAGVGTEPTHLVNESIQISLKKMHFKKINKSKLILLNKYRQPSKTKAESRKPVIIVPIEK